MGMELGQSEKQQIEQRQGLLDENMSKKVRAGEPLGFGLKELYIHLSSKSKNSQSQLQFLQ
jgi:translation elongation factor EF-1beta